MIHRGEPRSASGVASVSFRDLAKTMRLAVGDTGTFTAKMHHCAIARVATELSIRGEGPFAMTYVNPADDARRRTSCLDGLQTKPH